MAPTCGEGPPPLVKKPKKKKTKHIQYKLAKQLAKINQDKTTHTNQQATPHPTERNQDKTTHINKRATLTERVESDFMWTSFDCGRDNCNGCHDSVFTVQYFYRNSDMKIEHKPSIKIRCSTISTPADRSKIPAKLPINSKTYFKSIKFLRICPRYNGVGIANREWFTIKFRRSFDIQTGLPMEPPKPPKVCHPLICCQCGDLDDNCETPFKLFRQVDAFTKVGAKAYADEKLEDFLLVHLKKFPIISNYKIYFFF